MLVVAPLPGSMPQLHGGAQIAANTVVLESRAAARKVGLPTVDAYEFMAAVRIAGCSCVAV